MFYLVVLFLDNLSSRCPISLVVVLFPLLLFYFVRWSFCSISLLLSFFHLIFTTPNSPLVIIIFIFRVSLAGSMSSCNNHSYFHYC